MQNNHIRSDSLSRSIQSEDEDSFIMNQILEDLNQNQSFDDALIELHKVYGNKWKKISSFFSHKWHISQFRDDSFIKNHFYSLLRKALRKLNAYIKALYKGSKHYKPLKLNFVFKLTNLAQSERNGISEKTNYKQLLYKFLELRNDLIVKKNPNSEGLSTKFFDVIQNQVIETLLKSLKEIEQFFLDYNLNKKGKSKKKCPKKLEQKKDMIQKSLIKKQLNLEQDNIEEPSQQFLNSNSLPWSIQKETTELRSYEDEPPSNIINMGMFEVQNLFDPILFN